MQTPISIRRSVGYAQASETFFCSNSLGATPRGIGFATNGYLYVACFGTDKTIRWFDTNGVYVSEFSLPGAFDVSFGSDGALYAAVNYAAPTGKVIRYDWSGSTWTQTWEIASLNNPQTVRQHGS